jgi:DNA repair protein RecN (Recombination protein N)
MLSTLRIAHFAIIDQLEVRFTPGFNVVTGETGAGKSILIDALHLLLGGRAQADLVRTGFDECSVEGEFEPLDAPLLDARLDAAGLPACEDGRLVVRRTVHREGRSRAWVNGGACNMGQLGSVMRGLVDISGQHEHTSLLDAAGHLGLLDLFAGLAPDLAAYRVTFAQLAEADRALRALQLNEAERARRVDYLQFQLDEIDKVDPRPGEEDELRVERQRLASAGKLRDATAGAEAMLYSKDSSAAELAGRAADEVERAAALDPALAPIAEALRSAVGQLEDAARDLGRYARGVDDDPRRLDDLDERLDALKKLCRKHGGDVAQVLARRDAMRTELSSLTGHEEAVAAAEAALGAALVEARKLAQALSAKRKAAAREFAKATVARLADLEMKKTVFEVRVSAPGAEAEGAIDADGGRLTQDGQDAVEFLLSPNPGEEPKPLARIASGGELSRVMLAIKRVLAQRDPVETYVFDEVDAGIGGTTGEVVGRMIREVARERQVLCITHLAQIAAWGEAHYTVAKSVKDGRTHSQVSRLDAGEPREREVARMLSGHITPASLEHARELLGKGDAEAGKRKPRKSA